MKKLLIILVLSLILLSGCIPETIQKEKPEEEVIEEKLKEEIKEIPKIEEKEGIKLELEKEFLTQTLTKEDYEVTLSKVYYCINNINIKFKEGVKISPEIEENVKNAFLKHEEAKKYITSDLTKYYKLTREAREEIIKYLQYLKNDLCVSAKIIAPKNYMFMYNHISIYDDKNKKFYVPYDPISGSTSPQNEFGIGKSFYELEYDSEQIIYIIVDVKDSKTPAQLKRDLCENLLEDKTIDWGKDWNCDIDKIKEESGVFVFEVNTNDIITTEQQANEHRDISKCDSLEGFEHSSCVLNVAETLNDYTLCEYHNTQEEKDKCYNRFAYQYYQDKDYSKSEELCNKLKVKLDTKEACLDRALARTKYWQERR